MCMIDDIIISTVNKKPYAILYYKAPSILWIWSGKF